MSVAQERLSKGMSKLPRMIKLKDGRVIPLEEVQIGSVMLVCAGDVVAIDGVITKGNGAVDESATTGEYKPKEKNVNDKVLAGSIVYNGFLEVQTTEIAGDSFAQQLHELVEKAHQSKSKTEADIDHFSKIYTPIVMLAALLTAVYPIIF